MFQDVRPKVGKMFKFFEKLQKRNSNWEQNDTILITDEVYIYIRKCMINFLIQLQIMREKNSKKFFYWNDVEKLIQTLQKSKTFVSSVKALVYFRKFL